MLLEQCNVYADTLLRRALSAKDITFNYLRNHQTIFKMEINSFLKNVAIKSETDNYFKVIKFSKIVGLPSKQKKLKFYQLLEILPEKPLQKINKSLYSFLNDRNNQRYSLKDFILKFFNANQVGISENDLINLNEYACPSLFFYFYTWHNKVSTPSQVLSRNDAFDSAHCVYVPYTGIFVTDKGNAHSAKQALKDYNKANDKAIQTKIFSSCTELLEEIKVAKIPVLSHKNC